MAARIIAAKDSIFQIHTPLYFANPMMVFLMRSGLERIPMHTYPSGEHPAAATIESCGEGKA